MVRTEDACKIIHLGYEHDENDVHDVMLLCNAFQIAIPDEYKEK